MATSTETTGLNQIPLSGYVYRNKTESARDTLSAPFNIKMKGRYLILGVQVPVSDPLLIYRDADVCLS